MTSRGHLKIKYLVLSHDFFALLYPRQKTRAENDPSLLLGAAVELELEEVT